MPHVPIPLRAREPVNFRPCAPSNAGSRARVGAAAGTRGVRGGVVPRGAAGWGLTLVGDDGRGAATAASWLVCSGDVEAAGGGGGATRVYARRQVPLILFDAKHGGRRRRGQRAVVGARAVRARPRRSRGARGHPPRRVRGRCRQRCARQRAVFEDGWAGGLGSLHGPARAADVRMVSSTAPLAGVDELRAHILATLRDAAAFPGVRAPVPS